MAGLGAISNIFIPEMNTMCAERDRDHILMQRASVPPPKSHFAPPAPPAAAPPGEDASAIGGGGRGARPVAPPRSGPSVLSRGSGGASAHAAGGGGGEREGSYQPQSQELARLFLASSLGTSQHSTASSSGDRSSFSPLNDRTRSTSNSPTTVSPHSQPPSLYNSLASSRPSPHPPFSSAAPPRSTPPRNCPACQSTADLTSKECQICGELLPAVSPPQAQQFARRAYKQCASCDSPADANVSECQICGDAFPPQDNANPQMVLPSRVSKATVIMPYQKEDHKPLVWLTRGLKIRTPSGPREVQVPVLAAQQGRGGVAGGKDAVEAPGGDQDSGRWL